jgi:hypothetical protein
MIFTVKVLTLFANISDNDMACYEIRKRALAAAHFFLRRRGCDILDYCSHANKLFSLPQAGNNKGNPLRRFSFTAPSSPPEMFRAIFNRFPPILAKTLHCQ